jgi:RNA 3'-phosphate cyclase
VGTAGSVTLVLQALLPILFAARNPSRVAVTGGTDVRQAPSWDYFCDVLLPLLGCMGLHVRASCARRGYYPRGGGEVAVDVEPGEPRPLLLEKPFESWKIRGEAHVAHLPLAIAERMRAGALSALGRGANIEARALGGGEAIGAGGAVTLWAQSDGGRLGASRIAERGVRAETLGDAAGRELAADIAAGATLDTHAADQVLVYLALARGRSSFLTRQASSHARTAMWLIAKFLPARFEIEDTAGLVRVSATAARR